MTKRASLSPMKRLRIFEAANGVCYLCKQRIKAGEKWDVEHLIPLALGGADGGWNMKPAHKACHAPKTAADVADIARAKRRKARHIGIKKRSSFPKPPDGSRWDWKLGRRVFDKEAR